MSNYFDNQDKWSWQISDKAVLVNTDHGDHTHTLEITNVPIGEMVDHTGQVMGNAHRAASHDFKETAGLAETESSVNTVTTGNKADNAVQEDIADETTTAPAVDDESIDSGEDCEDGLDI